MSKKGIFKVMNHVITTFIFIVLLLTLFLVIATKASGGEVNLFGYQLKAVLSGSMEPEIKTGSIIAIKTTDDVIDFHKNDVITFRTDEGILVTHRIVGMSEDGEKYITKGDANDGADMEPVSPENIVGTYNGFTVPYVGYVMNAANSKEGAALFLILPGVLLVCYSVITIWQALRTLEYGHGKKEINTK
ncbi:signal peptidase I SipW [Virgibacillus sp. FSP13]